MGEHLARATVLFDQSRYDLAERELMEELAADPDSPIAHALLALCLAEREDFNRATGEAQRAIAAAPDLPLPHVALARVLVCRGRYVEALAPATEAIRLDPSDARHHALAGSILLALRKWPEALAAADRGLENDPEDIECTNVRATALVQLGRRGEAGASLESALARDPESSHTHANRGWALLHEGKADKALEHFREALRIDPTSELARLGLVEALKARHTVYGLVLRYFLWINRFGGQARMGIVVGGYIGYRVLLEVAEKNAAAAPFIWPVLIAYLAFAIMTWLSAPLFNLVLRLDRLGRLALSREQTIGANVIGGVLALTLLCAAAWGLAPDPWSFFGYLGVFTVGPLLLPLAGTFGVPAGWPRLVMALVTATMLVVRVGGLLLGFRAAISGHEQAAQTLFGGSASLFFYGILGSQFLANALSDVTVKK